MKRMGSEEARRTFRDLLDDAHDGEFTEISRHAKPVAVVVPPEWFERAIAALAGSDGRSDRSS
jgi:prevent-host-death family protein